MQCADIPCNPGKFQSMCCNRRDICLSNELCFTAVLNTLTRGVCWPTSVNLVSVAKVQMINAELHGSVMAFRVMYANMQKSSQIFEQLSPNLGANWDRSISLPRL